MSLRAALVFVSLLLAGIAMTPAHSMCGIKAAFERYVRSERFHPYENARVTNVVLIDRYAWLRWVTPKIDGTALLERHAGEWSVMRNGFSAGYDPRVEDIPGTVPLPIALRLAAEMPPLHAAVPREGDSCVQSPMWLATSNIGRPENSAASSVVNIVAFVETEDGGLLLPVGWAYKTLDGRWWYSTPDDSNVTRASHASIQARFKRSGIREWHCFAHDVPRSLFYGKGSARGT